jgi:hypothetical protein
MNLTFDKASAASSIAWLNPFSPPYDTSTILMTFAKIKTLQSHKKIRE